MAIARTGDPPPADHTPSGRGVCLIFSSYPGFSDDHDRLGTHRSSSAGSARRAVLRHRAPRTEGWHKATPQTDPHHPALRASSRPLGGRAVRGDRPGEGSGKAPLPVRKVSVPKTRISFVSLTQAVITISGTRRMTAPAGTRRDIPHRHHGWTPEAAVAGRLRSPGPADVAIGADERDKPPSRQRFISQFTNFTVQSFLDGIGRCPEAVILESIIFFRHFKASLCSCSHISGRLRAVVLPRYLSPAGPARRP